MLEIFAGNADFVQAIFAAEIVAELRTGAGDDFAACQRHLEIDLARIVETEQIDVQFFEKGLIDPSRRSSFDRPTKLALVGPQGRTVLLVISPTFAGIAAAGCGGVGNGAKTAAIRAGVRTHFESQFLIAAESDALVRHRETISQLQIECEPIPQIRGPSHIDPGTWTRPGIDRRALS